MYDITDPTTFQNIPRWLRELKDHANRDIVLLLVGAKSDLASVGARKVSEEDAIQMANEYKIRCIETSGVFLSLSLSLSLCVFPAPNTPSRCLAPN